MLFKYSLSFNLDFDFEVVQYELGTFLEKKGYVRQQNGSKWFLESRKSINKKLIKELIQCDIKEFFDSLEKKGLSWMCAHINVTYQLCSYTLCHCLRQGRMRRFLIDDSEDASEIKVGDKEAFRINNCHYDFVMLSGVV